jgi:phosphate transport system substrate-binding protein
MTQRACLLPASLLLTTFFGSCSPHDSTAQAGGTDAQSGTDTRISVDGSNTMLEAALAWSEAYAKVRPSVKLSVSGGGSGIGIKELIDGTIMLVDASRKMTPDEIARAEKNGNHPVEFKVGYDAIAIYVNKNNPVTSLTLEQLAGIYKKDPTITKWSQVGVTIPGGGDADKIIVISRQNSSGTHEYFKEEVLKKGDFRLDVLEPSGSTEVVSQVAATRNAIGYCGLAYANDTVKMVPIAKTAADKAVTPSIDSALEGTYPISRPLFMYSRGEPKGEVKRYLDWILSDDGQRVLEAAKYPPLRKLHN